MPDIFLDVDAGLAEVPVNLMPLIDSTDFVTVEDAIAYDAAGMDLRWNFVTSAGAYTSTAVVPTTSGNYDWAHQGDGMYSIEIPASGGASINNDTEGYGWFSGKITGVLPFRGPIIGFRAAALNDLLCDSAFSATRGLAGTALPAAAADGVGGLPISDAGGLDLDAKIGALTYGTANRVNVQVYGMENNVVTAAAIADAAIDRATFAADTGLQTARSNTAQAGAAGTITLDASASAVDSFYVGAEIRITGGTGVGQSANCLAYTGSTKVAIVSPSWRTTPDATSTFAIIPNSSYVTSTGNVVAIGAGAILEASFSTTAGSFAPHGIVDQGTAQSATGTTVVLRSAAAFADDELIGARITITGGSAGVGQSRLITDYDSATDTATVSAFATTPTGTITYKIFGDTAASGGAAPTAAEVADAVWDEVASGHTTNGTYGKAFSGATAVYLASGIAGTINTLDALDTAQDSQHSTTQGLVTTVDTVVDAILVDTNELQTDWTNGGRLDLIVDDILADTVVIGTPSNLGGGATVAANLSDIESQTDDIGAAGAGLTALATASELAKVPKSDSTVTWNATALASIQSEANDALVAYDPPTHAELVSEIDAVQSDIAALNNLSSAQVTTAVAAVTGRIAAGTIGSTGNSTTALHLTGLPFGNDELNDHLLVILDVSASEYHARWIDDWADTGDLATVATLPFTPENAVDTYVILPMRRDGSSATLAAILADTNELQADWVNGGRLDLILDARASQTSVDDLPTNAELATSQAAADDATLAAIATAQADLDILTGSDGVTLATSQPNYAPATATALASLVTTVGVAGAGLTEAGGTGDHLTAIVWNANWDAEVQSEVTDAIVAHNLDHLCLTATAAADMTAEVADNTILARILSNGDTSVFDQSTDGLQPIRDRGDAAWITATGFSTLTQTQVTGGAYALNSASFAFNAALDFTTTQKAATLARVTLVDTTTTNTDMLAATAIVSGGAITTSGGAVSSVTTVATLTNLPPITTGWLTAAGLATDAVSEIADGILSRNVSNVEGTAGEHTLCTVILAGLESSVSGTALTIKRTDGSTIHATKTLTKTAGDDPIRGIS